MNSYLKIAPKYLNAHKRKTRLAVASVVMAVTLVVGIFSMLDSMIAFEKEQVLKKEGNYHILVRNPSEQEIAAISSRIDVKTSGSLKDLGYGSVNSDRCCVVSIDETFASNLNFNLAEGKFPTAENEVMLEKWYMEKCKPALKIGDLVELTLPNKTTERFKITSTMNDWGVTKAAGMPAVFISVKKSAVFIPKENQYFILLKDGVNVIKSEEAIKKTLNIKESRIGRNEGLLMFMGQTKNNKALKIYAIGVILFGLVLVTAVVMIYNTFNISVMDRMRQFGLLRCIGASQMQIKRLVRREGLIITLKAIPVGVCAGMLMTMVCSAVLKYFNPKIYGEIALFHISVIGICGGGVIGFLSVFFALLLPARKASKTSPFEALGGANKMKISKKYKRGVLMKVLPAEAAIGVNSVLNKKKTLFLMTSSIAFSIIMFFSFSVLINSKIMGVNPKRAYTADIELLSKDNINDNIYQELLKNKGIKRVYGRMSDFVDITFDTSRLTSQYKKSHGITAKKNGLFDAKEKSWLISYDSMQLNWANEYLKEGTSDERTLNNKKGIIAVKKNRRNDYLSQAAELRLNDKVYIKTPKGIQEYIVLGVAESEPYSTEDLLTMATFITTEKLFTEITGDKGYKAIDIQLKHKAQEKTLREVKGMAGNDVKVLDRRQFNTESNNAYLTMALFIYGFVSVIALISVLNIINTMNTSIAAKMKYLGIMRAIGMSVSQLSNMVLAEAAVYGASGCLVGCTLGVMINRALSLFLLNEWRFPIYQMILTIIVCMVTSTISIVNPLKRIQQKGVFETLHSM